MADDSMTNPIDRVADRVARAMRWLAAMLLVSPWVPLRAEEIRIDLDRPGDQRVKPRIAAPGFTLAVQAAGHLTKLEPTTIRIETRQAGRWVEPRVDAGPHLRAHFDVQNPAEIRIESALEFNLAAGEERFAREREAIQREAQRRTAGKDPATTTRARLQLLMERIAELRAENIQAGADPRGRGHRHNPPLPRQALEFEKPDAVERILREHCRWKPVAQVLKATGFPAPDDKEHPEFAASHVLAEEIQQALMGIKGPFKLLSEGQYHALAEGSRYEFSAEFVPALPSAPADMLWRTAPAVRLANGLVRRARVEGSLDRQRGQTVQWWRIECDTPQKIQAQITAGDGDCFWSWVPGPAPDVRFVRVLLHSPGTRYRLVFTLSGAETGQEVTLYDGPVDAPLKAPF